MRHTHEEYLLERVFLLRAPFSRLIFTVKAGEGEDVASSLNKMLAHAKSPTFAEELKDLGGVEILEVTDTTSALLPPPSPPPPSPPLVKAPPLPRPPPRRDSFVADYSSSATKTLSEAAFYLMVVRCAATFLVALCM